MSEIADDFQSIQTCNSMYAYFFIKPFYNKGFLQTSHFMDNSFLIKWVYLVNDLKKRQITERLRSGNLQSHSGYSDTIHKHWPKFVYPI